MNKKKIVLNLDERTFQYLEVLAFGLNLERHDGNQDNKDRRAILPHEILGTSVTKYSLTYGANWISPSTPCVRFNFAQKSLR